MVKIQNFFLAHVLVSLFLITACSQVSQEPTQQDPAPPELSIGIPAGENQLRDIDGMPQVVLPGGSFLMGSTADEVNAGLDLCRQHYQPCNRWFYEEEFPQHEVTLSAFLIDQYEVSNQQFLRCVDQGACQPPLGCKKGEPTFEDADQGDHPVVCVSWQDARDYCEWAGGRLPTEAEWEYASRGPEGRVFPWGNEFQGTNLNYCDQNCSLSHADPDFNDGYPKTSPVGSYPAGQSWAGVVGLGGNAAEWVGDWYEDYNPDPLQDPAGPKAGIEKLIKGGSWSFPPVYSRGANRGSVDPEMTMDYLGFRCAGDPNPVIDGSIRPGEWEGSLSSLSDNGSELHLLRKGDYLYLALRSVPLELVSGNVFIQAGNEIWILHTSAALGTAIYQQQGEKWIKTSDFEWCCRSRADTSSALAMREGFYQTEGWLGINSFNGVEGELEYMIELDGSEIFLAVNITSAADPEQKQVWPAGIMDGPAMVLSGEFPEVMDFSPEFWIDLGEIPE